MLIANCILLVLLHHAYYENVEIYLHILLKADEPTAGVHAAVYGESVFIAVRPVRVDPRAADFSRLLQHGESEAICVVAEIASTAEPRGTSSKLQQLST